MKSETNFNVFNNGKRKVNKYNYDLGHKVIFDYEMGDVVPFTMIDVLPGDEINISAYMYGKMAPIVAPQLSQIKTNIRWFFVPYRLMWENFQEWYINAKQDINEQVPHINIDSASEFEEFMQRYGKLYRHFGIPELPSGEITISQYPDKINLLPLRAYNQIYYHYYLNAGLFTDVKLGLLKSKFTRDNSESCSLAELNQDDGKFIPSSSYGFNGYYQAFRNSTWYSQIKPDAQIPLISQGSTIKDLNIAKRLQRFYENIINSKNRYINYSNSLFGVAPNLEYDRPIYLGGDVSSTIIGDVEATTEGEGQPLGTYAGKGHTFNNAKGKLFAKEFGYLVGMLDITPDVENHLYLDRRITKLNSLDLYHPELENTYVDEITKSDTQYNYDSLGGDADDLVGYSIPYNEYRFKRGYVCGRMKSDLSYWSVLEKENENLYEANMNNHIRAQIDGTFVPQNYWKDVTDDLFAVTTEPQYFVQIYNSVDARRVVRPNYDEIIKSN